MLRFLNITSTGTGGISPAGGGSVLWSVNINTGASGAVLRIYNNTSAVPADQVAKIDCSTTQSFWYGVYCNKGIFYDLSVGAADVTIGYQ